MRQLGFDALFRFALLGLSFGLAGGLTACDDGPKRLPVGDFCGESAECSSGLCLYGHCLDPSGDEDNDGLNNMLEAALGSNPFSADTDGDGILDKDEVGPNGEPIDTDGDGIPDILESAILDRDGDCLPDQYDADDHAAASVEELQEWGEVLCSQEGVCAGQASVITLSCADAVVTCDYSEVPGYEEVELTCDGLDNNCDGVADEGHPDLDRDGVADCVDDDRDGDGIPNDEDNCPDVANPDQVDSNGNGRGDACDPPVLPTVTGFSPESPGSAPDVTVLGESDPSATVSVYADASCELILGEGEANEDGLWEAEVPVEEGGNAFFLRAKNSAGLESSCVPAGLRFVRDSSLPGSPSVETLAAFDWDGSEDEAPTEARYRVIGELAEGTSLAAYTDAACSEGVGEAVSNDDGSFTLETEWISVEKQVLYLQSRTRAGVPGTCSRVGQLAGRIQISIVGEDGNLVMGTPLQFHFPDGSPASPLFVTSADGTIARETLLVGSSITALAGHNGDPWASLSLGTIGNLTPGQDLVIRATDFGGPEFFEQPDMLFWTSVSYPEAPEGTSYVLLYGPGGEAYDYNAGQHSFSWTIYGSELKADHFDIALVAMGYNNQPLAYMVKEDIAIDTESPEMDIYFEGEWQSEGWLRSEWTAYSEEILDGYNYFSVRGKNGEYMGKGRFMTVDGQGSNGEIYPGENKFVLLFPPLEGLSADIIVQAYQYSQYFSSERYWFSAVAENSLPFSLTSDLTLELLPAIYGGSLRVDGASEGKAQMAVELRPAGAFDKVDLIITTAESYDRTLERSISWEMFQLDSRATEFAFPQLTEAWSEYFSVFRSDEDDNLGFRVDYINFNAPFSLEKLLKDCTLGEYCPLLDQTEFKTTSSFSTLGDRG